jgi:hypothetical protein
MKELVLKNEEIKQLLDYLDNIPHKYGKSIELFLNQVAAKRVEEAKPVDTKTDPE